MANIFGREYSGVDRHDYKRQIGRFLVDPRIALNACFVTNFSVMPEWVLQGMKLAKVEGVENVAVSMGEPET